VENKDKVVAWVVGSGFSKSLGGPMLNQLFKKQDELAARNLLTDEMRQVYGLFTQCESRGYVEHAEQFLEFVDTASKNPARLEMLRKFFPGLNAGVALQNAATIVANECDFLDFADTNDEGWQPYNDWAKYVLSNKNHYVLSFNYDTVLEKLGWEPLMPDAVTHRGPHRVLKLHGSISWVRDVDGTIYNLGLERIRKMTRAPVIATPGPTKLGHCKDETLLGKLWGYAKTVLREADVVVFMGYRFPPSDAHARSALLGAIGSNTKPSLRVHTVLGPDVNGEHSVRLEKLLEHTLEGTKAKSNLFTYTIEKQPLYVEDFLSVMHEGELYGT